MTVGGASPSPWSSPGRFRVHTESFEDGRFRVDLRGDFDLEETGMLERALGELVSDGAQTIVLELSALEALGSGLARAFARAHTRLGWRNGRLSVAGATAAMAQDLRLAGLDELL